MPVNEEDWKIVRITRELAARLDTWRAAQLSRGRKGVQRLIGEKYATISYNAAIRELLARDERHRERGKEKKKRSNRGVCPKCGGKSERNCRNCPTCKSAEIEAGDRQGIPVDG